MVVCDLIGSKTAIKGLKHLAEIQNWKEGINYGKSKQGTLGKAWNEGMYKLYKSEPTVTPSSYKVNCYASEIIKTNTSIAS